MGFYFVSGSHDRTARVWNTEQIQPVRILAGHLSDIDVSVYCTSLYLLFLFFLLLIAIVYARMLCSKPYIVSVVTKSKVLRKIVFSLINL